MDNTLAQAIDHHRAGRLLDAVDAYQSIRSSMPGSAQATRLLSVAYYQLGQEDLAVRCMAQFLNLDPAQAAQARVLVEVYNALGNGFSFLGNFSGALPCYEMALRHDPKAGVVYNNLGNALHAQGRIGEAIETFHAAISADQTQALFFNNLGNALIEAGRIEEAVTSYQSALRRNPNEAAIYFNLHAVLLDYGDIKEAVSSLSTAALLSASVPIYNLFLDILLDYSGDASAAHRIRQYVPSTPLERAQLAAWRYVKALPGPLPALLGTKKRGFELALTRAPDHGLVLEFGVRFGNSIKLLSALLNNSVALHGFDSFEGLPSAWHHEPSGTYSTGGVLPDVPDNIVLHKGLFRETLPGFLEKHPGSLRLANIDSDLYQSAHDVLQALAPRIVPGSVLIFDEFFGNENWEEDEFKAFAEAAAVHHWQYEYLSFSLMTKQAVIRIL